MKNCILKEENDFKNQSQWVSRNKRKMQGNFGLTFSIVLNKVSSHKNRLLSEIRENSMETRNSVVNLPNTMTIISNIYKNAGNAIKNYKTNSGNFSRTQK